MQWLFTGLSGVSLIRLDYDHFSWLADWVLAVSMSPGQRWSLWAIQGLGALVMVGLQVWSNRWMFSLKNYLKDDQFDPSATAEMLLFSPIREEIIFRGVMFSIFYRRVGGIKPRDKFLCVVCSSLIFGSVHLINLFGHEYSLFYICLQVTLGVMVGGLYCLRFVISDGLTETILLHMSNNLFSSFLPLDLEFNINDPLIIFPLLETFAVYSLLIFFCYRELMRQPSKPFPSVDLDANGNLKVSTIQEDSSRNHHSRLSEKKIRRTRTRS